MGQMTLDTDRYVYGDVFSCANRHPMSRCHEDTIDLVKSNLRLVKTLYWGIPGDNQVKVPL